MSKRKGGNYSRLKVALVEQAIRDKAGNLSLVATFFDVSRTTIYKFLDAHPDLLAVVTEARETMIDNAESALYKAVLKGDVRAITFFLRTQGRSRGYVERMETTGKDGGPVEIRVRYGRAAHRFANDGSRGATGQEIDPEE